MPTVWGTGAGASATEQRPLAPPDFRRELTPTWLSACALLAGAPPLDTTRGLRVVDLQCRSGVQAAVIAAVHPDADVLAFDGDPANVERARHLATAAGLDNLSIAEAAELQRPMDATGDVDVLLLDDVVALSDDSRSGEIRDVVRRRVRPGGLVAVAYRTESAWAEVAPLRHLARQLGDTSRFADMLTRLRDGGARYVTARPHVRDLVEQLLAGPPGIVEALLLEDRSEAASLEAVSSWLAPAGACFVGSARLSADELGRPLAELLADTQDVELREQLRDIAERPPYRIDLFRRGRVSLDWETHAVAAPRPRTGRPRSGTGRHRRARPGRAMHRAPARRPRPIQQTRTRWCGRRWREGLPTRCRSCRPTRPRREPAGSTSLSPG